MLLLAFDSVRFSSIRLSTVSLVLSPLLPSLLLLPLSLFLFLFPAPSLLLHIKQIPQGKMCEDETLFSHNQRPVQRGSIEAQLAGLQFVFFFVHLSLGTFENLRPTWPIWWTRRIFNQPQPPSPSSPNRMVRSFD